MSNRIFAGAGVALITPMNADSSVNYDKLDELVEMQVNGGTDAIIVCGTTGESSTLSHEEHCMVIQRVVDRVNGRIPVVAGTGSNDTAYAVELSKEAEKAGVNGVLVVSPYYNKASQTGLVRHYTAVADSVGVPVIVYDIPSRTGCSIALETFEKLAEHGNIAAVKAATGNISQIASIKAACGDKLDIYSGNDDQIVPILSLGGAGVISVLSNVLPQETHAICQLYFDGKVRESAGLQLRLLDLVHKLFIDVNPIPVKEAMNLMGMAVGGCRLPLCELDPPKHEALQNCLRAYGML